MRTQERNIHSQEYIYDNYKRNVVIYEGQALRQFSVAGGESYAVGMPAVTIDSVLRKDTQLNNLNFKYSVTGGGLKAPVKEGQKIATVEVWYRNSCMMEAELFAMADVKESVNSGLTIHRDDSMTGKANMGFFSVVGVFLLIILVPAAIYLIYNNLRRVMARKNRRRRRASRRRSR